MSGTIRPSAARTVGRREARQGGCVASRALRRGGGGKTSSNSDSYGEPSAGIASIFPARSGTRRFSKPLQSVATPSDSVSRSMIGKTPETSFAEWPSPCCTARTMSRSVLPSSLGFDVSHVGYRRSYGLMMPSCFCGNARTTEGGGAARGYRSRSLAKDGGDLRPPEDLRTPASRRRYRRRPASCCRPAPESSSGVRSRSSTRRCPTFGCSDRICECSIEFGSTADAGVFGSSRSRFRS